MPKKARGTGPQQGEGVISLRWIPLYIFVAVCFAIFLTGVAQESGAADVGASSAHSQSSGEGSSATAPVCSSARQAVPYYRFWTHLWQTARRAKRLAGPGPNARGHACGFARYAAEEWQGRSRAARYTYGQWREERFLEDPGDWNLAVQVAQRAYPGTADWLLSCSASEGGHGRWVPNSQGSGVGGWMQMYHSTWSTMFYGWSGNQGAYADLRSRGFIVDRRAHSWYSPLGQALASAYGMLNGRGGEWFGGGC